MLELKFAYLTIFVMHVWSAFMRHGYQRNEVYSIAREVAHLTLTDQATWQESVELMQIAGMESGFTRKAKGKLGECGPWQILGGNDCSAHEALRRMRTQGMVAYVGCRHASDHVTLPNGVKTTCQEMINNRIGPADEYLLSHPTPKEDTRDSNGQNAHLYDYAQLAAPSPSDGAVSSLH